MAGGQPVPQRCHQQCKRQQIFASNLPKARRIILHSRHSILYRRRRPEQTRSSSEEPLSQHQDDTHAASSLRGGGIGGRP